MSSRIKANLAIFTEGLDKMLELDREIQRAESHKFYHADRKQQDMTAKVNQRDDLRANLIAMYEDMCRKHY